MTSSDTTHWIANQLRSVRKDRAWTQAKLAKKAKVSQPAIALWEKGKRTPGIDELVRLALALEEPIDTFLPQASREPIRAVLRAESLLLDHGELAQTLEGVVDEAEVTPIPDTRIRVHASHPHQAAEELLVAGKMKSPPIRVEKLAKFCGVRIIRQKIEDALSGAIIELEDGPVIAVNKAQVQERQRFTIAHELGHHLLRHHDRFHLDLSGDSTEVGEPPGHNWVHEREANQFAADLLMPASMVRAAYDDHGSIPDLAALFEVSTQAMSYRLLNLGLPRPG